MNSSAINQSQSVGSNLPGFSQLNLESNISVQHRAGDVLAAPPQLDSVQRFFQSRNSLDPSVGGGLLGADLAENITKNMANSQALDNETQMQLLLQQHLEQNNQEVTPRQDAVAVEASLQQDEPWIEAMHRSQSYTMKPIQNEEPAQVQPQPQQQIIQLKHVNLQSRDLFFPSYDSTDPLLQSLSSHQALQLVNITNYFDSIYVNNHNTSQILELIINPNVMLNYEEQRPDEEESQQQMNSMPEIGVSPENDGKNQHRQSDVNAQLYPEANDFQAQEEDNSNLRKPNLENSNHLQPNGSQIEQFQPSSMQSDLSGRKMQFKTTIPQRQRGENKQKLRQCKYKNVFKNFSIAIKRFLMNNEVFQEIIRARLDGDQEKELRFLSWVDRIMPDGRKIDFYQQYNRYSDDSAEIAEFKDLYRELSLLFFQDYAAIYLINSEKIHDPSKQLDKINLLINSINNPQFLQMKKRIKKK